MTSRRYSSSKRAYRTWSPVVHPLLLDVDGIETVLAVHELDDVAQRVPNGAVVLGADVLEGLDQSPLDVAGLGSLDAPCQSDLRDQPWRGRRTRWASSPRRYEFSTKPRGLGGVVVLGEVRKRPVLETKGNTLALDNLLADKCTSSERC